ncbi:MAG: 50S ribosomal protein L11 methyltransferase [Saprospiraceae bacterium]
MDELNQNYYRFDFHGILDEIIYARLYELGFESFEEKEDSTEGYIPESLVHDALMHQIQNIQPYFNSTIVRQQNWNTVWESSFSPVTIDEQIHVRATFHPATDATYEIIIDPKMAFGTGHHSTTYLVLKEMLTLDFKGSRVLDFGCGSGILAIGAEKLGAAEIVAVDYDKWSVENTLENIELNQCSLISVYQADNLKMETKTYDFILANITRDILIANTYDVLRLLSKGGIAIYSGFIEKDLNSIMDYLSSFGIQKMNYSTREDWCVLVFDKP